MVATSQPRSDGAPEREDQRVRLHGVPWSHYEILLAVRGDAPVPRIAYLEGELELMSPSLDHEMIKSRIRQLVEAYAAHRGIDLWPVGSWTIRSAPAGRGVEPDEGYTLGDPRGKHVPDLAIEVVWTRGGIDKLAIYRELGVGEVWFWRDEMIEVYRLHDGAFTPADGSAVLPGLDVALVGKLAVESPAIALARFRAALGA